MVLVHSPSVGPSTWLPVAGCLHARGVDAVVANLTHIGVGGPPYWPRVAATVSDAMGQLDEPGPVVFAAHSNAGLFMPAVVDSSPRPVVGVVFVDAGLPAPQGRTPVAAPDFLEWLRRLADSDGRLPRWTDWWPERDVASMLPDPGVRAAVVADQPRLPIDFYEQTLPVPDSRSSVRCAYLQFTSAYDPDAARARSLEWPTALIRGEHLHQVVDPDGVASSMLELIDGL